MSGGSNPTALEVLAHPGLRSVLEQARTSGLLGRASEDAQVAHSLGFLVGTGAEPTQVVDLGAGGGVPGLVVAVARPAWRLVLVDAAARRCRWLEEAVERLGLADRVTVVHARAEDLGRGAGRGGADLVLARSFGPPPVTAECAAPMLRLGGRLVVSEPPSTDPERWPPEPLGLLGLVATAHWWADGSFQALELHHPCPERFPRRPGVPAKRPLW